MGRKSWATQLKTTFDSSADTVIWFHCASLGEFEQGRPLMEKIKQQHPRQPLLLTFFSPSGYEIRKNYKGVDYVCYLPLDTAANAATFLDIIQPQLAIFVKYEFWYSYLKTLQQRNIPIYLIGAIFRPNQYFFKWYGRPYRTILKGFTHIFVQDQASYHLLQKEGYQQVSVAGDPRIDRVVKIAATAQGFPIIEAFKQDQPLLILGSAHEKDLTIWQAFFKQNTYWKVLIAPHEVHPTAIKRIQQQLPIPSLCYTDITEPSLAINSFSLIINTIGILNQLYQYADVVYIGGGFGTSIHNTLEPAVFGVPILIGPKYQKFEEAKSMKQQGGLKVVEYTTDIQSIMKKWASPSLRKQLGHLNQQFIENNAGGTEKIYNILKFL